MKNFFNALLRAIRGAVAEKKHGNWETSKGSVAFWTVFGHCMYVWSQSVITETSKIYSDVSPGEKYTLWALLSYAGVKIGGDTIKHFKSVAEPDGDTSPTPEPTKQEVIPPSLI